MARVPNNNAFSLQDVVDVVIPSTNKLTECFTDSVDAYFDPLYKGSKNKLSNFRNYGWTLVFDFVETEDHGSRYLSVHGNEDFLFCAYANGIISYSISGTGFMIQRGTSSDTDPQTRLWADPSGIIFSVDDARYIRSWTYDAFGDLTLEYQVDTYSAYGDARAKVPLFVCTDNNKFLFVINNSPVASPYYKDIMVLDFESDGSMEYKSYWRGDYGEIINGLFYAGGFLFAVTSVGIRSFTVNQTTGALTLESTNSSYGSIRRIWSDNAGYLYCGSGTYGMMLFSYDGNGDVSFMDNSTEGNPYSIYGNVDNGFVYMLDVDHMYIRVYRRTESALEYVTGEWTPLGPYPQDLWCPPDMTNSVVVCARYDNGISSYELV